MDTFLELVAALRSTGARFVVIGVWGANYYATSGTTLFTTLDRDLFLPLDAANLLSSWKTCVAHGLRLSAGREPVGEPLDPWLEERVVGQRALTHAKNDGGLQVDLSG